MGVFMSEADTDQRRRFYCIGLPKAGTHSLADMVTPVLRTAHEPEAELLIPFMSDARRGTLDAGDVRRFLLARDQRLNLEFESSHLLGAVTPHVAKAFPDARFILLVRECRSWIDSMINDQLNLRSWERYDSWIPVYEYYLRCEGRGFPAEERALQKLRLYPLSNYVRSWCRQILRIVDSLPSERLLTIRTGDLASTADELADFLGVRSADMDLERTHTYRAPRKHYVLDQVDGDYVSAVIEAGVTEHDPDLFRQFA